MYEARFTTKQIYDNYKNAVGNTTPKNANQQAARTMSSVGIGGLGGKTTTASAKKIQDSFKEKRERRRKNQGSTYDEVPQSLVQKPKAEPVEETSYEKVLRVFNEAMEGFGVFDEPTQPTYDTVDTMNVYKDKRYFGPKVYSPDIDFKDPSLEDVSPKIFKDFNLPSIYKDLNTDRLPTLPESTTNILGVDTENPLLNRFGVGNKTDKPPAPLMSPPSVEVPANMDPMTRTLSQAMIPQAPPVMVDYEVGSFRDTENLMTIVEDLNRDGVDITLEELAKANDLPVNPDGSPVNPFVQKGEVIKVPVQGGVTPPTEFMDKETKAMLQETTPIKASYSLADQLASATRALKKLTTGLGDTTETTYEVKANDTLSKIAREKGITLSDIKLANPDIDYDKIKVGQKINIPKNGTVKRIKQAKTTEQVINTVSNSMPVVDNPLDFIFRQGLIGLDENNPAHQNSIKGFLNNAVPNFVSDKSQVTSSKKAWCGAFVDHVLSNLGIDSLNTKDKYDKLRARKYLNYGEKVDIKDSKPGDLVIVKNPDGFHVTFLTSISRDGGTLNGLGGNQNNSVKVSQYKSSQVQGIRRIGDIKNVDTETIKNLTVDIAEGKSTTR